MSNRRTKALMECARAMGYFLSIGWRKSDLDMLEKLWWSVHDEYGNVKEPEVVDAQ